MAPDAAAANERQSHDAQNDAWVAALVRGDIAPLAEIFAHYRSRIFSYHFRMTKDRALAEDLCQEVFLRLAKARRKLLPSTALRAWLFTVAHHALVSHWRAAKAAAALAEEFSQAVNICEPRSITLLEKRLGELEPAFREILILCAVEGMSAQEAAMAIGISHDAARQRLKRAREALGQRLRENEGGPLG